MKQHAAVAAIVFATAGLLLSAPSGQVTQGALLIRDTVGRPALECPLKHTDVKAEISGFIAKVTVTQDFENSARDKVEASYVFPLPHNAAVNDMTMQIGTRVVKGTIRRREEANAIFEAARNAGRTAALLDQERPNIFTQSVTNIPPGAKVRVVISYIERLPYEAGTYEFVFPMVVGPRYIPMTPASTPGGDWKWDTTRVPDAARITPPLAPRDQRAGHDISLQVDLNAGVPLDSITSSSHEVVTSRSGDRFASIRLKDAQSIPNKDFVLRYDVAGRKISDAVLTHSDSRGGFFTLLLQPPERLLASEITPKEIVFVLDTSGSMNGFPIEKAKEAMRLALKSLNPQDTFNLITFAGDTHVLFARPVSATPDNLTRADAFLANQRGSGGTEMMKAIRAALDSTDSQKHIRVVCFMTDGYVGNEAEIISEVGRHPNARVFSFGIGSSVNRYLLDKMAEVGRGEVEYVSLSDDGSAAARRFHERVRNPVLTDITVEWNGLPVVDVLPAKVPDLFSAKPVVITGRFTGAAKGIIRLRGKMAGAPVSREIPVTLPAVEPANSALPTLWARTKIDSLSHTPGENNQAQITDLGLSYHLMTPFTSFVAVEETTFTEGGKPRKVEVPVELPEGVSREGIVGSADVQQVAYSSALTFAPSAGLVGGAPPTPIRAEKARLQESARAEPRSKIDPALLKQTGSQKIRVQIFVRNASALAEMRKLGVELLSEPKSGTVVIARLTPDQLQAVSRLDSVLWIGPGI